MEEEIKTAKESIIVFKKPPEKRKDEKNNFLVDPLETRRKGKGQSKDSKWKTVPTHCLKN